MHSKKTDYPYRQI